MAFGTFMEQKGATPLNVLGRGWASALGTITHRSFRRGVTSFVVLIAAWEIVGRFILTNQVFAVPFSAVVEDAYVMWGRGELQTDIAASLTAIAYGIALATVCGIIIGVLLGASNIFREYVEP